MSGIRTAPEAGFLQGISLLLPCTLAVMGVLPLVPVVPQLFRQFGSVPGAGFLIPILLTLPALCIALFSPLAAMVGDRLGRRRVLLAAMVIYAGAGVSPFFLNDLTAIIATRFVVGLCEAAIMTLSTALIGDTFPPDRRERWLSAQAAVASISALVFMAAGGLLGRLGWQGPFLIYLGALVFALMVAVFVRPSSVRAAADAAPPTWVGFPWPNMLKLCGITLFASVLFYALQLKVGEALGELGVTDPARIGFMSAVASLGVPLGALVFVVLSRRMSHPRLLALEFLVLGVSFAAMGLTSEVVPYVALTFVGQLAAGMLLPTLLTWSMRALSYGHRARGQGLWQGTFALGQFVCGLLTAVIAMQTGSVVGAFQVLGFLSLIAAGIAATLAFRAAAAPVGEPGQTT